MKRQIVDLWLSVRVVRQRRDVRRARGILSLSHAFSEEFAKDYGVPPEKIRVVPNCVAISDIEVGPGGDAIAVVGRLAVRKGLEDVVALARLRADVRFDVIGSHSLWSDYRGLFERAPLENVTLCGHRGRNEVFSILGHSAVLLQLSRYEPFGLTVVEALASGTPVVVTPAVGAAEDLPPEVHRVVQPGDIEALERAVDELVHLSSDAEFRTRCRVAADAFAPSVIAERLEAALYQLLR